MDKKKKCGNFSFYNGFPHFLIDFYKKIYYNIYIKKKEVMKYDRE